jgi:hypothetical protein
VRSGRKSRDEFRSVSERIILQANRAKRRRMQPQRITANVIFSSPVITEQEDILVQ